MTKVYVLLIQNYDALDGYMTKNDIKVFASKEACEKWIVEETKRQAEQGFKLAPSEVDPECWEFVKEEDQGTLSHEFYGQYRDVIGSAE